LQSASQQFFAACLSRADRKYGRVKMGLQALVANLPSGVKPWVAWLALGTTKVVP
jgi:hypothetical protein